MTTKRCGTRNKLEKKEGGSFPLARTTHASRSLPLRLGLRPKTRRKIQLLVVGLSPFGLKSTTFRFSHAGKSFRRFASVTSFIKKECIKCTPTLINFATLAVAAFTLLIMALDFSHQGRDSSAHQYESASTFVLDSPPSRSSYDYRTCGSCRGPRSCGRR